MSALAHTEVASSSNAMEESSEEVNEHRLNLVESCFRIIADRPICIATYAASKYQVMHI